MEPIKLERSIWINATCERVWRAVTEPDQIAAWFAPGTPIVQKGNVIAIRMGDEEIDVAIIEVFDPPRQLTTRSLPDKIIATTYMLVAENGGTRFTVIESGLESLSPEERQKRLEQDSAGWEMALENLKAYIDGRPLPRPEGF